MSILTYIIGLPLLAAIVLAFVPRNFAVIMRFVAIAATLSSALLAVVMFAKFQTGPGVPAYQFEQQIPGCNRWASAITWEWMGSTSG